MFQSWVPDKANAASCSNILSLHLGGSWTSVKWRPPQVHIKTENPLWLESKDSLQKMIISVQAQIRSLWSATTVFTVECTLQRNQVIIIIMQAFSGFFFYKIEMILVKCWVLGVDSHRDALDVIKKVNSLPANDRNKLFQPASLGDDFGPTWSTHLFKVLQLPAKKIYR